MTIDLQTSLDLVGTASQIHQAAVTHVPAGVVDTANQKITDVINLLKTGAVLVSLGAVFFISLMKKFKVTGIVMGIAAGGLFFWGVFNGIGWMETQMRGELPVAASGQATELSTESGSEIFLTLE
ncbi:hypothetical protein [Arthrobacter sp. 18067]|uniref:hypothetical protein n=1 Tax=Arthrobacter sp. 18067 TaxID=2681413 RepID=UPI001359AF08|nr:hypothetical protein [Arthrobacter sp. 18067]